MVNKKLTILGVGDMIVGVPEAETRFALVEPILKSADLVVGQGEYPFTANPVSAYYLEIPTEFSVSLACDPSCMSALNFAGFNVITLAGNHIWDAGTPGIEDTIAGLRNYSIAVVGAGMNIDEARHPAIIERNGTRFGFLNYNCVGPKMSWATPDKPGCAYVNVITHYELHHPTPGGVPTAYTFAESGSLEAMIDDIYKLKSICDILVVVFHKGGLPSLSLMEPKLPSYEQQVSYTAIDAGADLILAHHAHILRGIEQYKGKTIFHGLGNFVIAHPPAWTKQQSSRRNRERFGVHALTSDPDVQEGYLTAESRQTIIAKCTVDNGKISQTGYLPCLINKQGQPEIVKHDERGQQIFDYMEKITREEGLNARYDWEGDEVVVHM